MCNSPHRGRFKMSRMAFESTVRSPYLVVTYLPRHLGKCTDLLWTVSSMQLLNNSNWSRWTIKFKRVSGHTSQQDTID